MLATCQFSGDMSALYLPSWILSVHQEIDREYHVHEGGRQGSIVYSWRGIHTLSGAASTMTGLCRILGLSIWVLPLRKTPAEMWL
ncbi:uncharacterized protein [Physcomitrium patens]|uniref:uncharacterized protein isoform X2 n=1 Tax=Physcomitrium patens TaxID=3218 RepID=UPI003CCD90DB